MPRQSTQTKAKRKIATSHATAAHGASNDLFPKKPPRRSQRRLKTCQAHSEQIRILFVIKLTVQLGRTECEQQSPPHRLSGRTAAPCHRRSQLRTKCTAERTTHVRGDLPSLGACAHGNSVGPSTNSYRRASTLARGSQSKPAERFRAAERPVSRCGRVNDRRHHAPPTPLMAAPPMRVSPAHAATPASHSAKLTQNTNPSFASQVAYQSQCCRIDRH